MILTGPSILEAVKDGEIEIDPFNRSCVNPNSVDLHLGREVAVYDRWAPATREEILNGTLNTYRKESFIDSNGLPSASRPDVIDVKDEKDYDTFKVTIGDEGIVLVPDVLYLMHTEERVTTDVFIPVLDGKSSIGRLGVFVHATAGYGDTGFDGQYTLEVTVVNPVRVYAGMRFCQIRFNVAIGDRTDYKSTGHYIRESAEGAVASKAYEQFVVERVMKE